MDSEVVNEQGWQGQSLDYTLGVTPSSLTGTLVLPDGTIVNVGYAPDFLKAIKNIERMFRERYGDH